MRGFLILLALARLSGAARVYANINRDKHFIIKELNTARKNYFRF